MQTNNIRNEISNFLSELVADVKLESEFFLASILNLTCRFHFGRNIPHLDLIKTAFLRSDLEDCDIEIFISTDTDLFTFKTTKFQELVKSLHPSTNRFDNFRFSADPSGNFLYFYDVVNKIGGVWLSPNLSTFPEMLITPFRALISWIIESEGAVVLHASSFTLGEHNIILSGPSGSGKSTIAFEALARSEMVICDDALALTSTHCFPIYTKMKLKSLTDSISVAGKKLQCEQVGSKSVLNLTSVVGFQPRGYHPDYILFPSMAFNSNFLDLSKSDAIKKVVTDSFSETLGSPLGALKLIKSALSNVNTLDWQLEPDPTKNWEELRALVGNNA